MDFELKDGNNSASGGIFYPNTPPRSLPGLYTSIGGDAIFAIGAWETLILDGSSSTDGSNPNTATPYHDKLDSLVSYEWDLNGDAGYDIDCAGSSSGVDLTGSNPPGLSESDLATLGILAPGVHFVWLRVADEAGVRNCTPIELMVCAEVAAPTVGNNSPICEGQMLYLTASSLPGATYSWTGPNGFTSNEQNPSIPNATAATSGTYSVTATVGGCTSPAGTTIVIVSPIPAPTISGSSTGCSYPGVTLATQSYAAYQWQRSGQDIPGATDQTYTATLSGQYTVRVASTYGCSGVSSNHHVTVYFCPNSEISASGCIYPLRLAKDSRSPTGYYLYFQAISAAAGYNIYVGLVGKWYSHGGDLDGRVCSVPAVDLGTGEMQVHITPPAGNLYYLVTAFGGGFEGPSGFDSSGSRIPDGRNTCAP